MMPSDTLTEARTLGTRLTDAALKTFGQLVSLGGSTAKQATEMQDKFHSAVCDINEVRIGPISELHGTFYVSDGVLHVNEEPVARILQTVIDEFEKRFAANDLQLEPDELPQLIENVFIDFLLHEVRHRTQGVGDYDVVQRLKAAAGRSSMAEMDSQSDRDAAWAYASASVGWSDRRAFLEKFREALFMSGDYYFKVFPVSSGRHDKIERAAAVLLMAARLARIDFTLPLTEQRDLPLDAALSVVLSSNRKALAIYRAEPSKRLLGVANDADGVVALVGDINAGRFDDALETSVHIMDRLNLLG